MDSVTYLAIRGTLHEFILSVTQMDGSGESELVEPIVGSCSNIEYLDLFGILQERILSDEKALVRAKAVMVLGEGTICYHNMILCVCVKCEVYICDNHFFVIVIISIDVYIDITFPNDIRATHSNGS